MASDRTARFLDDLRHLIAAGVPLRDAARDLASRARPASPVRVLAQRLDAGDGFGAALRSTPGLVSRSEAALLHAGHESGRLPETIVEIVADRSRVSARRRDTLAKMAYPVAILFVAVALSPLASWLMTGAAPSYWPVNLGIALTLVVGAVLAWRGPALLPRGSALRSTCERIFVRLPFLGRLVTDRALGRTLALEGRLLRAGLTFDASLPMVADAAEWGELERELRDAAASIARGASAADAFSGVSALDAGDLARLRVAEATGRLDEALVEIGEERAERSHQRFDVALRLLPVVVYIAIGVVVLRMASAAFGTLRMEP